MSNFYVVAIPETHNWDDQFLADNGVRAVFGLYLVKEGEVTHLCELTPSSRADFVSNQFVIWDDARGEFDQWPEALQEAEYGNGDEHTRYIPFFDITKADKRFYAFSGNPANDCPDDVMDAPDPDEVEWGIALEWERSNPSVPKIAWGDADFEAWEAEQTAKRRAENRPPLYHRDQLPLFAAALGAWRKARGWEEQYGHDLSSVPHDAGRAEWEEVKALGWA